MNVQDVVFATDFSETSEAAGRVAREMALETGARLHIVHVSLPGTDPGAGAAALTEAARRLGTGVSVETALLSGRAAREIVRYAGEKRVGVIVIATHGRTGVSRQLLGSVAEAVIRLAPCLVLTVPAGFSLARMAAVWAEPLPSAVPRCVVCAGATDDLICETCRARIRGEALERKFETERAGRRGAPA